ncbi:MAG: hypothetical protein GY705_14910 [Bacteroidetes bacterium]|nr:hypothetical protein [Bacteroidota bacterium]
MNKKITNLPNRHERNKRLLLREGKLLCEVSERWVQLPSKSYKHPDINYLHLDIMTKGVTGNDRKICELVVDRNVLEKMLKELPNKDCT